MVADLLGDHIGYRRSACSARSFGGLNALSRVRLAHLQSCERGDGGKQDLSNKMRIKLKRGKRPAVLSPWGVQSLEGCAFERSNAGPVQHRETWRSYRCKWGCSKTTSSVADKQRN